MMYLFYEILYYSPNRAHHRPQPLAPTPHNPPSTPNPKLNKQILINKYNFFFSFYLKRKKWPT